MKKLLLALLGGLFIVNTGNAQSYATQGGDTVIQSWDGMSSEIAVYNRVKSNSANSVVLRWRVTSHYFAQNWEWDGLCDNIACYDDGSSSPNSNPLMGAPFISSGYAGGSFTGVTNDFHTVFGNLPAAANNTSSWVRVIVKDNADTTNQANWRTLTFVGIKGAGSNRVSTIASDDDVVIYPNPARDAVNVIFGENSGVRAVGVYNLIGKAVKMYRTSGNSAKIELNEVPAGMYLLRLMNGDGQVIATRKFNHQ